MRKRYLTEGFRQMITWPHELSFCSQSENIIIVIYTTPRFSVKSYLSKSVTNYLNNSVTTEHQHLERGFHINNLSLVHRNKCPALISETGKYRTSLSSLIFQASDTHSHLYITSLPPTHVTDILPCILIR